jgi:hypothetical protein
MQARITFIAALFVMAAACGGSQTPYHYTKQPGVVTQVNLHPDPKFNRLYSNNYQQEGLIPVCTPVNILSVNPKAMKFEAGGATYEYLFAKQLVADKASHLDQLFGTSCPDTSTLSETDQMGIKLGKITPGMTKKGVLLAAGYPPDHANQIEADTWKYWRHKFGTFEVIFEGDVVTEIKGGQ